MAEKWLTVKEMAERSGFSKSFFYTNKSLAKHGHKAAVLPPMVEIGRSLRCRVSAFEQWLEGPAQELSKTEAV
jgi:predicted DNA-binding transcriptional regulator AlpA